MSKSKSKNAIFNSIEESLNYDFVERRDEIHSMLLATLSDNNILLLGPPGVGKSLLAKRWSDHIKEANYFSWLLSPSTKDSEIAGPPNIKKLTEEGIEERNGTGKIQEAHIATLDEIFKSSSAIANFLLKILNERKFDTGMGDMNVPMLTVVAASNELPDEESSLEAAVDRFVIKHEVGYVNEASNSVEMMRKHIERLRDPQAREIPQVSLDEIKEARELVKQIKVDEHVMETVHFIATDLRAEHVDVSPRTLNKCLQILQAEAFLQGNDEVEFADLQVLLHCLWNHPSQIETVYDKVFDKINPILPKVKKHYEAAKDKLEELKGLEDEDDIKTEGLEAFTKLKEIKKDIEKLIKKNKPREKDMKEVKVYLKKIDEILHVVNTDILDLDVEG